MSVAALLPALLVLAAPIAAQAPADPVARLLYTDAARYVTADAPEVRGEAALVLAASGEPRTYDAILAVAKDAAPEAQLRGVLALGYLGDPAAQHLLDDLLADSASRVRPNGIAAAFALGLLPDDRAGAAIARQLLRFQEASMKRQRDVALALVTALCSRGSTAQGEALRQLRSDEAIRDPELRTALWLAVAHIQGAIEPGSVARLLDDLGGHEHVEERRALLRTLADGTIDADPELVPGLERLAGRDRDAAVRAAALAVLTRLRHLPALDLAARSMRASDPREIEQAARTALQLGGAPMRRAIERQIDFLPDIGQAALLRAFSGAMSVEFEATCLRLARDARARPALRQAAALALAQAGVAEVEPVLRELFVAAHDLDALLPLARAVLLPRDSEVPPLSALHDSEHSGDLAQSSDRLCALLLAGHPHVSRFCVEQLQRRDLPAVAAASVLRAVRMSRLGLLPTGLLHLVPEPVQTLLR